MVTPPEYLSTPGIEYSRGPVAEIHADLARLEATLDRADVLVAEALRPEPRDWERHFTALLAEAAADGRRRAARMKGGA